MPTRITPCRAQVSDRFPVASFVVQVPADRYFELALTTDPALFHGARRAERRPSNFHTSRQSGLMRAPAGEVTYLVPGAQLRRFAGKQRIYYAIATFASPRGDDARTSVQFDRLPDTPYIQLAQDFTGRALDRSRLSGLVQDEAAYGAAGPELTWGGDLLSDPGSVGAGASDAYDDGFDPALWQGGATGDDEDDDDDGVPAYARDRHDDEPDDDEEDEDSLGESYGHPGRLDPSVHAESYGAVAARTDEVAPTATWGTPTPPHASGGDHCADSEAPAWGGSGALDDPYGVFELSTPPVLGGSAYEEPADDTDPAAWDVAARAWESEALSVDEDREPSVDDWEEDDGYGQGITPPAVGLGHPADPPGAVAFDPVARSRILYALAGLDGEQDPFSPVRCDVDGLRWGLGFDQRSGSLGRVLDRCRSEDAQAFDLVFGDHGSELVQRTCHPDEHVRMGAVGGEPLTSDSWRQRFERASAERPFRKAQLKEAVETEIEPQIRFAGRLGLHRDRAFAALVERSRAIGADEARAEFAEALCPVKAAAVAEGHTEALDRALEHLGVGAAYGGLEERLERFQEANGDFGGAFTPETQALLIQALRERPAAGLEIPEGADVLGALQAYGSADDRIAALWTSPHLQDQDLALAGA